MPRYMIHCSTTRGYWLIVEAPNEEAVHTYYSGADGDEFHAGDEDGWTFHEVEELIPTHHTSHIVKTTDVVVDDSGKEVTRSE